MSRLAVAIATVGALGFLPIAPGTWGSLAGLLLLYPIRAWGAPGVEPGVILATFVVGTWAAGRTERELGRKDPGPVVIDEVLGMLITLAWLPATIPVAVAGFLLFRVYDVIKPFPAERLEHAPGGLGIMLDDAMAGVYAHLTLRVAIALTGQ